MASGNSWQVYQELGSVPSTVLELLDQPLHDGRRDSQESDPTMLQVVRYGRMLSSTSAVNLKLRNERFAGQHSDRYTKRRRSYSQPRLLQVETSDGNKLKIGRGSSFRTVKEKMSEIGRTVKNTLEEVLITTPTRISNKFGLGNEWSSSSSQESEEDLYTTASDYSGFRTQGTYWGRKERVPVEVEIRISDGEGNMEKNGQRLVVPEAYQFTLDPNCPIHGEKGRSLRRRRIESRPRGTEHRLINKSMADNRYTNEELKQTVGTKKAHKSKYAGGPVTKGLILKLARNCRKAAVQPADRAVIDRMKKQILRNLLTLSVAFLFLISAFQGLQNLQTTINGENGLGAISLTVVYLGSVVSCMFIPPYLLNRIGCKMTLILCMCTFSIYMLTHFSPRWYSLLPSSLLIGLAFAPLWSAKCTYLSEAGLQYAELNFESSNAVIVRFFGIFFMVVHLGQVFGNLISSWILKASIGISKEPIDAVDRTCGHFFGASTNLSSYAKENLARPPSNAVYSLCAVYFCCTLVAALIIAMFLYQLRMDSDAECKAPQYKLDVWNTTLEHLRKPRHLLLLPLTIFNGMQQAFIAGEFTKAYVGCCLGVTHIGYVMMSFGLFDAVCSLVFGPLIKLFGRMPLLMFGAVVDMLMIFTLAVWPPNPADTVLFYVIAGCWGMADGVWSTQINGLWVVIFAENLAAAFANYRLWESVGFIIAFSYSSSAQTTTKLYILLAMLYVGMIGYGLIELWEPFEDYAIRLKHRLYSRASMKQSPVSSWRQPAGRNGSNKQSTLTGVVSSTDMQEGVDKL